MGSNLSTLLSKVPQYTRNARHFRSLLRHSTPRKLLNLVRTEYCMAARRDTVSGKPYIIIVDPINHCNLRCPLCPSGTGNLNRDRAVMSYQMFTGIIEPLIPYAYEISFHNWGESLLNPEIFKMITFAARRGVASNMSTNLNIPNDGVMEAIVGSGLEYIVVSLDAASPDVYRHYRRGGDFDLVLSNLRSLIACRNARGSKTPIVEWQFIVMKHNVHEVERARTMSREIGVENFRLIPVGFPFGVSNLDELRREWAPDCLPLPPRIEAACFYLYRSVTINADGGISPCCMVSDARYDFGNLLHEDFADIWNNERYRSARRLFAPGANPVCATVCNGCTKFRKRGVISS